MASMLAYFSAVWAGEADPLWPHVVLLSVSIISAFTVGAGILLESPKYSDSVHRVATWLVLGGIAVESLCTVLLFVFDERVSGAQQSKIIALETRIAPRILTTAQSDVIQTLRSKVPAVFVLSSPDIEPAMFSAQLQASLVDAGISVNPIPALPGDRFVGAQICFSDDEDPKQNPLWNVLSDIGMNPATDCSIKDRLQSIPKGVPVIVIGERPPFFPNGEPKSFRLRAYPGFNGASIK
jgi:hypothetical protein